MPDQDVTPGPPVGTAAALPPRPRRGWTPARKAGFAVLYAGAAVALLVGGLKAIDWYVGRSQPPTSWLDCKFDRLTIRTLELYPYEGFHCQANMRHLGPMPWVEHTPEATFDVRTGDKGFFIDFSLENPPPKTRDEFRVILIGGSGAQGWGGTRNETMFYSVLERELNRRFAGRGTRVRVINLAMQTTFAYQSFVSLNRWAHDLEPDLILAYVGRNEFFVPVWHEQGTDAYTFFRELNSFSMATRGGEYPPKLAWLFDLLPNVMRRTSIGLGLKIAFGWDHFEARSRESYVRSRGLRTHNPQQVIDDYATPLLIHSLKSIKRDFSGVPMMVAWQPIRDELWLLRDMLPPGFYDVMWERTRAELAGYVNDQWYFINVHHIGERMASGKFEVHLDDTAHAITGRLLADQIGSLIPGLVAERERRRAAGLPAYGR